MTDPKKPSLKGDHEKTGVSVSGADLEAMDLEDAPVAAKAEPAKAPVEMALSEEDLATIRAKAKANVAKEIRDRALKEALEDAEREERIAAGVAEKKPVAKGRWPEYGPPPVEEDAKVQVTIALPPYADSISVDGALFFDGHTSWVSVAQYQSLIEQMQWSWYHQDVNQITSKRDAYRQRSRGRDAHLMMGAVKPSVGAH